MRRAALLAPTVLLLEFVLASAADCPYTSCGSCASATDGCGWCLLDNKCSTLDDCQTSIFLKEDPLNCPRSPDAAFAYNETEGREVVLPLVAAAYNDRPSVCLGKKVPSVVFYDRTILVCDGWKQGDFCSAYTAYDPSRKTVIVAFRGSHGDFELFAEFLSLFKKQDSFVGVGKVFDYFVHAFNTLWDGGIGAQVRTLRKVFPAYKVLVVGHSLGGALASLCSVFLVQQGIVDGNNLRLVTFGEPRTGDTDYAAFLEQQIPYSYRIVHNLDPIPHLPPLFSHLRHHRFELWYPNDMTPGKPYELCPYADIGNQCSEKREFWQFADHTSYYHPPQAIPQWGMAGCP